MCVLKEMSLQIMMLSYPDAVVCVRKEREAPVSLHAPELCFDYIGAMREDTHQGSGALNQKHFQRLFFALLKKTNVL